MFETVPQLCQRRIVIDADCAVIGGQTSVRHQRVELGLARSQFGLRRRQFLIRDIKLCRVLTKAAMLANLGDCELR